MKKKALNKKVKKATAVSKATPKMPKPAIWIAAGAVIALAAGMVYSMANENALKQEAAKAEAQQQATAQVQPAVHDGHMHGAEAKPGIKYDMKKLVQEHATQQDIPHIDIEEAKMLYDSGKALFIDARGQGEYDMAHIKGALCIPPGEAHTRIPEYKDMLKGKVLVTYCHGAGCHLADKTAYKLHEAGYKKVAIFFGGWPKWEQHQYPEFKKQ